MSAEDKITGFAAVFTAIVNFLVGLFSKDFGSDVENWLNGK